MKILGIIPARYASTRFPGKPLVVIDGKTMIRRVYEQAMKCTELSGVIVATDDPTIHDHVSLFGGNVMMTGLKHRSGTERCREVVEKLGASGEHYDLIINIQGDEPYIEPAQIAEVASCLKQPGAEIATLVRKITDPAEISDPNVVKVVIGAGGMALYFSRSAIPFVRGKEVKEWMGSAVFYKHVGIYGYRSDILERIVNLPLSPLESAESLEQLRWLEYGFHIHTQDTQYESVAIDSPADLLKITNRPGTFF